jgi:hypothetical protein
MRKDLVKELGRVIKLLFILIILAFISFVFIENPISWNGKGAFDLESSILISAGFAGSFRAMLCCRKKV